MIVNETQEAKAEVEYVRTAEAIRLFGYSRSTLERLGAARKVKAVKYGRTILWSADSLRAYAQSLPAASFTRKAA